MLKTRSTQLAWLAAVLLYGALGFAAAASARADAGGAGANLDEIPTQSYLDRLEAQNREDHEKFKQAGKRYRDGIDGNSYVKSAKQVGVGAVGAAYLPLILINPQAVRAISGPVTEYLEREDSDEQRLGDEYRDARKKHEESGQLYQAMRTKYKDQMRALDEAQRDGQFGCKGETSASYQHRVQAIALGQEAMDESKKAQKETDPKKRRDVQAYAQSLLDLAKNELRLMQAASRNEVDAQLRCPQITAATSAESGDGALGPSSPTGNPPAGAAR